VALPRARVSETGEIADGAALPPVGMGEGVILVRAAAAAAGLLAVGLVVAQIGLGGRALLVSALAVLSAIDLERRILPNRIVLPSFALVLAMQLALFPDQAVEWIAAAFGTGFLLLVPAIIKPGGVGFGDVKLGLLLGAGLGEEVLTGLAVGLFALWPVAIYLYARHGRAAGKLALPFGPFLAFGAVVALLLTS
jgi:leader peptidase (prepilin peptidase)/N-methyltransferase